MKMNKKKALLWGAAAVVVIAAVVLLGTMGKQAPAQPQEPVPTADPAVQVIEEPAGIPLDTDYIVLSYPAELEEDVSVSYLDLEDGQKVVFTTQFTGEEMELFYFTIGKDNTDGFFLGTLKDEKAGELQVCVHVPTYTQGKWTAAQYTKLLSMQDRVNDIIVQVYEDPRFESAN